MKRLIIIFFGLLPFLPILPGLFGFDFPLARILAVIIFLLWLFKGLLDKKLFIPLNLTTFLLVLFLFFAAISGFWTIDKGLWFKKFLFLLNVFLLYFPLYNFVNFSNAFKGLDNFNVFNIVKSLFYGGFFISILAVFQFLAQFFIAKESFLESFFNIFGPIFYGSNLQQLVLQYPSFFVNVGGKDYLRAFGFFASPQNLALFVGMVLFLSFFIKNKISKSLFYFGSFTMILAIIFTFSRGAYIALITTLLLYAIKTIFNLKIEIFKKVIGNKAQIFVFATVLLLIIYLLFVIFNPAVHRFADIFSSSDGSRQIRFELWQKSFNLFKENFIWGVGLGSLPIYIEPDKDSLAPVNAHNTYLEIGVELGIVGLVVFLLIFLNVFKYIIYDLMLKKQNQNPLLLSQNFSFLFSIFYFLIYSIFETTIYFFPAMTLLILTLSINDYFKLKLNH